MNAGRRSHQPAGRPRRQLLWAAIACALGLGLLPGVGRAARGDDPGLVEPTERRQRAGFDRCDLGGVEH